MTIYTSIFNFHIKNDIMKNYILKKKYKKILINEILRIIRFMIFAFETEL